MDAPRPNPLVPRDWITWLAEVVVVAALYFGAARLGLALAHHHENATLIWPPTGLALAVLLLFGRRLWPGVALGALLASVGAGGLSGLPAAGVAMGNTLEAVVGVSLMLRAGMRPSLARLRDVSAFLLIGVLGCTTIGASVGVGCLWLAGNLEPADLWAVWRVWWLGDMGGAMVLTPALLMMVHGRPGYRELAARAEFWLALAASAVAMLLFVLGPLSRPEDALLTFVCFPILVWAGTRLGSRGASLFCFLIVSVATVATALDRGPFASRDPEVTVMALWGFSMVVGLTTFTLVSVVEERNRADRRLQAQERARVQAEQERMLLLERERITREMHDGIGGQLVSVLANVERGRTDPGQIAESLRRALDEIRIVIDSLDPETTDLATSLGKLRARLTPLLERNGIALVWKAEVGAGEPLSPESVLHVLRVIQEAVTNAMRHAAPSRVEVTVEQGTQLLRVRVRDDGRGLASPSPEGRGLRNMRRRADDLGGTLTVRAAEPGTLVELVVPLPA